MNKVFILLGLTAYATAGQVQKRLVQVRGQPPPTPELPGASPLPELECDCELPGFLNEEPPVGSGLLNGSGRAGLVAAGAEIITVPD